MLISSTKLLITWENATILHRCVGTMLSLGLFQLFIRFSNTKIKTKKRRTNPTENQVKQKEWLQCLGRVRKKENDSYGFQCTTCSGPTVRVSARACLDMNNSLSLSYSTTKVALKGKDMKHHEVFCLSSSRLLESDSVISSHIQ